MKRKQEQQKFEEMTLSIAQKYIDGEITKDIAVADMKMFLNSYHADGGHDDESSEMILSGAIQKIRRESLIVFGEHLQHIGVSAYDARTNDEIAIERLQKEVADLKETQEAMASNLYHMLEALIDYIGGDHHARPKISHFQAFFSNFMEDDKGK